MGFRFHRSIKLLPGIRLNFGMRGISASIGVRGAHVTYGPNGTRTTVGLPGSGLSYTHLEKAHHAVPIPTTAAAPIDSASLPGSAGRGVMWIALIVVVLVAAFSRVTNHAPPAQTSRPPQAVAPTIEQMAARAAEDVRSAEIKKAALGVTQIRHGLTNSNTLRVSRVTVMPSGAICFRLHLRNSHGVGYARTAVIDGTVLSTSWSNGSKELWNRLCAPESGGHDVTSAVDHVIHLTTQ